jgi:surface antigen
MNQAIKPTFLRGISLFVAVLLVATVAPQILSTKTVFAGDGYPWDNATCLSGTNCSGTSGTFDWGYTPLPCPSNDPNCLSYPYPNGTNPTGGMGDTWGYGVRNCTSYVAYKINQQFSKNIAGWGDAKNWNTSALAAGYTDDTTPQQGDIAQWTTGGGGHGHVAYVGAVDPTTHVATFWEYNYAADGNFLNTYTSTTQTGVSNYIHIGNITPPPPVTSYLIIRQGSTLSGKAALTDTWATLTTGATDFKAAGTRIAYRDGSGNIIAKDLLGGTWYTIPAPVDQYAVTPNLIVVRAGGAVYEKANLGDSWTTVTSSGATDIKAAGYRLAYLDSSGTLWARDGVSGTSVAETSSITQYAVTPNYLLVRQGGTLLGKAELSDTWATLTTGATDFQAAATRIAFRDGSGNIVAKDTLGGTWYTIPAPVDQYVVTSTLLIIRVSTTLYGKAALTNGWSTLTTGTTSSYQAAGTRIAIVDTGGNLDAKDTLGGTWYTETGAVDQYAVTSSDQ